MTRAPRPFFTVHESLIVAVLAALGAVSSTAVSMVGASLRAALAVPGAMQALAGVHVLWLVLAVGLIRKPGAATLTGVFKGCVELLSGNPHGLFAVVLSSLGGLFVDAAWIATGRRDHPLAYMLAGGVGAASNLLVFALMYSLPSARALLISLAVLAPVAFVSGALLAGLLGWSLLCALRRAGVAGVLSPIAGRPVRTRTWAGAGAAFLLVALLVVTALLTHLREAAPGVQRTTPQPKATDAARTVPVKDP